ncbi:hypothetical protein SCA6_000385, partial [Theobroma cacao]
AVGLLVKYSDVVDVNAKNSEDLTALEYISKCDENDESTENQEPVQDRSEITKMLRPATRRMHPFMAMLSFDEELIINTSNSSTLGGKLHDPGTTVMPKSTFSVFWTYNTLTLLTTLGLTAFLLPGGAIAILLLLPLSLLCSSYMLSMSILSPTPFWSKVNTILSIVFIMLLLFAYPRA